MRQVCRTFDLLALQLGGAKAVWRASPPGILGFLSSEIRFQGLRDTFEALAENIRIVLGAN
jgi:hypothetical protein